MIFLFSRLALSRCLLLLYLCLVPNLLVSVDRIDFSVLAGLGGVGVVVIGSVVVIVGGCG